MRVTCPWSYLSITKKVAIVLPIQANPLHNMKRTFVVFCLTLTITAQAQTGVEAWARRYNVLVDSHDEARVIKVDGAGNVIVAGETSDGFTSSDLLLIKYSNSGVPLWTNRYDGPAHSGDQPIALTVDADNNVIVTANSIDSGNVPEIATLKYSSTGLPLWTNRYHGPSGSDYVYAVAADSSGNVFVAGGSVGIGTSDDYVTIKYSSAGIPLWTNRYNGPGNGSDYPIGGLALDTSGNVFVTGASESGTSYDLTTVAYSSTGTALWVNRYRGMGDYDEGEAVAVTGTTVLVAGASYNLASGYDLVTLAYSTAGTPLWTNRYNGPGNSDDFPFALAAAGTNVFVTGHSAGIGTQQDYATLAYSTAGVPLWTNRYNGPGNSSDSARAMTLDSSGNVLVTGYSFGSGSKIDFATMALSSAGMVLWVQRYNGPGDGEDNARAVAVDSSGNVFITGTSASATSADWATIKYLSTGVGSWTNRYNGLSKSMAVPEAVAVDSNGNVFVTGSSWGSGGGGDYNTIKYSSIGSPLWTNRYNGPGNNLNDTAHALAIDTNGNVFVTGLSAGLNGESDYATIKYSNAGVPLWTNRYDGPGNGLDEAQAVAVDGSGNVIVTGTSDSGTSSDYVTIKYSSAGVPLWTNRYDGVDSGGDTATALAVDGSGNVIVTGNSGPSVDYATIKYSSTGIPLWTNFYEGYALPSAVTVDSSGNVIVTGSVSDPVSNYDYATIKYSSAGVPLWTNRYDGPVNGEDNARAVAVDSSGNVYVTGFSYSGASDDYVTIAYSSAGVPLWTNRYDGLAADEDQASAVVVDSSGLVFVTGHSAGLGSNWDFTTIAYSKTGLGLWTNRYNGPLNGYDEPYTSRSMAVAGIGSVVVVGTSAFGQHADFATVKYITVPALSIRRTATNTVAVSWTPPSTDFRLQQNTNGLGTVNWSNVLTAPIDNGTNKTLIVNPPTGSRFYRLVYP